MPEGARTRVIARLLLAVSGMHAEEVARDLAQGTCEAARPEGWAAGRFALLQRSSLVQRLAYRASSHGPVEAFPPEGAPGAAPRSRRGGAVRPAVAASRAAWSLLSHRDTAETEDFGAWPDQDHVHEVYRHHLQRGHDHLRKGWSLFGNHKGLVIFIEAIGAAVLLVCIRSICACCCPATAVAGEAVAAAQGVQCELAGEMRGAADFWEAVRRFATFVLVGLPAVFLALMAMGAVTMSVAERLGGATLAGAVRFDGRTGGHLAHYGPSLEVQEAYEEHRFEHMFEFMASALTGGAFTLTGWAPGSTLGKICATLAGSVGIVLFGFTVGTLGSSVAGPVAQALGVAKEPPNVAAACGQLGFLTVTMLPACFLMLLPLGAVLAAIEGQPLGAGVRTVALMELGGVGAEAALQTVDDGIGSINPSTNSGRLIMIIIAVWSVGFVSLVVSVADGPAASMLAKACGLTLEPGATVAKACGKLALFIIVVLPIALMVVMFVIALAFAPVLGWPLQRVFWMALPAVTGGIATVTNLPHRMSPLQQLTWIGLSVSGVVVLSIALSIGGGLLGPVTDALGFGTARGAGHGARMLALAAFIVTPALVMLFAVPMGGLLAHCEGWPFLDGFWWSVAAQLGGGMPLGPELVLTPVGGVVDASEVWTFAHVRTELGRAMAMATAAWSVGVAVLSVGLGCTPAMDPLVRVLGIKPPEPAHG